MKLAGGVVVAVMMVIGSGCGSKPQTADGALRNIQESVVNNSPEDIFKALPASYQSDINALVADAAKRMDTELWNESTALLKQAVGLLKSKRELLLASPMMASVPNKEDVAKNWDAGVSLLHALVNSQFTNIERLRQGNMEGLLAGDGAALMAQVIKLMENSSQSAEAGKELAKLKASRISLVSETGETAIVKIETPDQEPENIDMIKVEGVWIPREMAEGFKQGMTEARASLAQIDFASEEGKQKKTMALMQIGAIKPLLAQLEAAKTQEDLQAVLGGLMMGLMGAMNP